MLGNDACIEPDSNIYFVTGVDSEITPDDIASITFSNVDILLIGTDGDETVTASRSDITFVPTAYTLGDLPATDSRVQTGASDEFIKVSVVNNSAITIRTNTAWILAMDSNGFPLARFRNNLAIPELQSVEPGEEFEFIFRNDLVAGEVSSIRVITESGSQ